MPPLAKPPLLPSSSVGSVLVERKNLTTELQQQRQSSSSSLSPPLPPKTGILTRPRSASRSLSPSPRPRTSSTDSLKDIECQLQTKIQTQGHGHVDTAELYNEMGNLHFRNGNLKAANASYRQAIHCEPGPHVVTAYMNLGTVYWSSGDAVRALVVLDKALECHTRDLSVDGHKLNESPMAASIYHQIGLCYALQKNFLEAMNCMLEAYTIRMALHNTTEVAKTLDAMGKICYMQGEFKSALKHHELAYDMLNLTNAPTLNVLKNMANAYEALGKTRNAIAIWKDIAEYYQKKPHAGAALQSALISIARLYDRAGNKSKAEQVFHRSQQIAV